MDALEPAKVLVAEDDPSSLRALTQILTRAGYEVFPAANGLDAFRAIDDVDLMITDITMPGLDGLDLLKEARKRRPDIRVIIMTAYDSFDLAVTALHDGACAYLTKPIDTRLLLRHVREAAHHARLANQVQMLTQALLSIPESVYITDMDNTVLFVNASFCKHYGYEADEILGSCCERLWKSERSAVQVFRSTTEEGWSNEFVDHRKDGSEFPVILSATTLRDRRGQDLGIVRATRDITERKRFEEALERLSYLDALTGLPNRRSLDERLSRDWESWVPCGGSLAVVMIDVDCLKEVNDGLGHQAGDACIRKIGAEIRDSLRRPLDFAARFGGDEFVVLLPGVSDTDAFEYAEGLRQRLMRQEVVKPASHQCRRLSVSVGVAATPPSEAHSAQHLLCEADQALYRAKAQGRNRVESSVPDVPRRLD